jgi:hypothetical protein
LGQSKDEYTGVGSRMNKIVTHSQALKPSWTHSESISTEHKTDPMQDIVAIGNSGSLAICWEPHTAKAKHLINS